MSKTATFYVITPEADEPRVYDVVAAGTDIRKVGITADPFTDESGECVVIDIQTADDVDIAVVEAALMEKARQAGFTVETEDEHFAESDARYRSSGTT